MKLLRVNLPGRRRAISHSQRVDHLERQVDRLQAIIVELLGTIAPENVDAIRAQMPTVAEYLTEQE